MNRRVYSGESLHDWVKRLPIGHLQLSWQLSYLRSSTIGDLFDAVQRGALARSSPNAVARIKQTLNTLIKTLNRGKGSDGWDLYRKARPRLRSYKAIYFASPRLSKLAAKEGRSGVAELHLSRRAINALQQARITTLSRLIKQAEIGIIDLAGLGQFKAVEIVEALDALADATDKEGTIDWIKFASLRGFRVLPERQSKATPEEFIRSFPSLCQTAVFTSFTPNALAILQTRLLRSADQAAPRPALGKHLSKNRETVRLHETEIVEALRGAIWERNYCNCRFRFREEFVKPLHALRKVLCESRRMTWADALRKAWDLDRESIRWQEVLLLRLLGKGNGWALHGTTLEKRVQVEVRRFISRNRTREFSTKQLRQHLRRKLKTAVPALREVVNLLQILPNLERINQSDSFRVRLSELSYTDRCEVFLRARGRPMHIQELTSALADTAPERKLRKAKDTVALIWPSSRFIAIGKSGYWALREWKGIETRTIADVAADLLGFIGKPVHENDLFKLIKKRRPLAQTSVSGLLREDPRFVRIARAGWTLKSP